jgi:hypothetical protein
VLKRVQHKVKVRRQKKSEYIYNFSTTKMPCPNKTKKTEQVATSNNTFDLYSGDTQFESQTQ